MTHQQLTQRHTDLIAWAKSCLETHDWHALRDAAADLEVCEARMEERCSDGRLPLDPDKHYMAGSQIRSAQSRMLLGYTGCRCHDCMSAQVEVKLGNAYIGACR